MKRSLKISLPIFMAALLILAITNCGADKEEAKAPESVPEMKPAVADYLEKDVVLAGVIWEDDGFYSATIFPVRIITQANVASKGEYEVMVLSGLVNVKKDSKHWTKNVILKSHPAKKDELKPGMVILYTGGDPCKEDREELKVAKWLTGVVLNMDELSEDIVELKQCGGYRRIYKRHLSQLRISDDPVIKAPKEE